MSQLTERLVKRLRAAGAPKALIKRAERNEFHPFKSKSLHPVVDLYEAIHDAADRGTNLKIIRKLRKLADSIEKDQQHRDSEYAGDRTEREEWLRGS